MLCWLCIVILQHNWKHKTHYLLQFITMNSFDMFRVLNCPSSGGNVYTTRFPHIHLHKRAKLVNSLSVPSKLICAPNASNSTTITDHIYHNHLPTSQCSQLYINLWTEGFQGIIILQGRQLKLLVTSRRHVNIQGKCMRNTLLSRNILASF
jgi:hypothetical protein